MEIWKRVKGFGEKYEVSNIGRVRSKYTVGRPVKDGILSQQQNLKGYKRVRLCSGGKDLVRVVHRLVAETFLGECPADKHEVNHKNGVKYDNRLENLEWVTRKENNAHSVKNGFWSPHRGENHGRSKITEPQAKYIKSMSGKVPASQLSKKYGVSSTAIRLIWRGINWRQA